jgi:hypothetical protein
MGSDTYKIHFYTKEQVVRNCVLTIAYNNVDLHGAFTPGTDLIEYHTGLPVVSDGGTVPLEIIATCTTPGANAKL